MNAHAPQPLHTAEAAVFPDSEHLRQANTAFGKFDADPVKMYEVRGGHLWLPRAAYPIADDDRRVEGEKAVLTSKFMPRNETQAEVVRDATSMLLDGRSFILSADTGFGKTYVGTELITRVGRKTLIIVPKSDCIAQWVTAIKDITGLDDKSIGHIQGNKCKVSGCPIVIGMIHSLAKKDRYPSWVYRTFGMVIWDEVHRVGAETFSETCWRFPAKLRLGLSATPKRGDGKSFVLKAHIGPVAIKAKTTQIVPDVVAINSGWKVPMVYRGGKARPIPHTAGKTMHLNKLMAGSTERNDLICRVIVNGYKKDRNIMFFSDLKNSHLPKLRLMLMEAGIPASDIGLYVGGLSDKKIEEVKTKRVILATYKMASEATDIPRMDVAILGTPRSDVVQIVGRVRRDADNKKKPIVIDLVDGNSDVLAGYYKKRVRWYHSIGANVKHLKGYG